MPRLWPGVSLCRAESLGAAQIIVHCVVKTCDPEDSAESEEIELIKPRRNVEKAPLESGGDVHASGIQATPLDTLQSLFPLSILKIKLGDASMDTKHVKTTAPEKKGVNQPSKSSVGATAAQAGYAYQLNVSVLAALRLLLITKSATRITLEPANEEDLETELSPAEPGLITPKATLVGGYKLVVQVKSREGEPWSIEDFKRLLNHGERRTPAKHHLDDLNTHYLLVTNADAKGVARRLLVSDFEEKTDPLEFPPSLEKTLPNKPEGRVAIWGGLTEQLIEFQIKEILSDLLRIPHSRLLQCCERLRKESQRRMRGSSPGVWERDDLLATIRDHGGFLASAAELAAFVEPSNFEEMLTLLHEKNAIVITGPSGTGKTLAALALCEQARLRSGSLEVVTVNPNDSPATTRRLVDTGPTLFYLEDPWGQYSLRNGSEAWTEQLPKLLRDARPSNRYVITSRKDVMVHARADGGLNRWSIELNAEHYSGGGLATIYDKRMAVIATNLQPKALDFRRDVLGALETPLELDLFFTNLADGPLPEEMDHAFLRRLLGLAHRDAVEEVVVRYLDSIDQIGLSAVIWGLFAARGHFDRAQLSAVARQLRRTDVALGDSLEKAVDRLIATRHLRQPTRTVAFAHPSVRAGFETFLKENWFRSEATLAVLISALVSLAGPQQAWGLETAARALNAAYIFRATIENIHGPFETTETSQAAIDAWLNESLLDREAEFQPLLKLAADVGSSGSIPSELARWFIKGRRRGADFFIDGWAPPFFSVAWYERVSADPRSALIADRFIREQLPQDDGHYGREFVIELDQIAAGLEPAFLAAAHNLVGTHFHGNAHAVALGAVRDLLGYEVVLAEALSELDSLREEYQRDAGEQWRAIEDGECDSAYEEAYTSSHDEDGYASGVIVETYISAKRSLGCWHDLANHEQVNRLAKPWARAITASKARSSAEEILCVLSALRASEDEAIGWDAARRHWYPSFEHRLFDRILSSPSDELLRRSLVACACAVAPDVLLSCFKELVDSHTEFVHLLVDLSVVLKEEEGDIPSLSSLSLEAIEIFDVLMSKDDAPKNLGRTAVALLEAATSSCPVTLLAHIVPIIIASGGVPVAAIRRWLIESTQPANAVAAAQAAISIGDKPLVWLALNHARADARCLALEYLVPGLQDPLPAQLLNLAFDRGSRVRRTLVSVLSNRPHCDHLPVLMQLSKDQWSDADPRYDEPDSYPIARESVAALAHYTPLPFEKGAQLLELAESTDDRRLRREALLTAAELGGPKIRQEIWTVVANENLGLWARVDGVDALSRASNVETELLERITAKWLMKLSAPLAASVTVLVSQHLPVPEVVRILERVGQSQTHRALLLLGVIVLESRDHFTAVNLLGLLDAGHPARRVLNGGNELLPHTVLDDLGDVRIRKQVQLWLKDRIEKI